MVRSLRTITHEEGQKLALPGRHPSDATELDRAIAILPSVQQFTPPYIARSVGYAPELVRTLLGE